MAFHSKNKMEHKELSLETEIRGGGLSSNNLNSVKNHDTKIMVSNRRTFKPKDETEREFLGKNVV